jgi:hypothetical protein
MNLSEGFTFGINEVVMTVLCGISGYLNIPRKKLLYFLIVITFASIIPDFYSYYEMQRNDNPGNKSHSIIESFKNTFPIIIAELVAVLLIAIPLMIFNNKKLRALGAGFVGVLLILVTKYFSNPHINIIRLVEPAVFALFGAGITYFVTSTV